MSCPRGFWRRGDSRIAQKFVGARHRRAQKVIWLGQFTNCPKIVGAGLAPA